MIPRVQSRLRFVAMRLPRVPLLALATPWGLVPAGAEGANDNGARWPERAPKAMRPVRRARWEELNRSMKK